MLTSAPVSRPNSLAFTLAMASPITARPSAFATAVTGAIAVDLPRPDPPCTFTTRSDADSISTAAAS